MNRRAWFVAVGLTGCWWDPCPTEGVIDVLAVDGTGASLCLDAATAVDPDGTVLEGRCGCGCSIDTLVEGEHLVTGTIGEDAVQGTADLSVFERCVVPRDTVRLVFP